MLSSPASRKATWTCNGQFAVQRADQLDAFGGLRHEGAGATGAAAHQYQFADPLRVSRAHRLHEITAQTLLLAMNAAEIPADMPSGPTFSASP